MLIQSGPSGAHLYVVVTKRCSAGAHLLLSVTSIRPNRHHDPACALDVGDHGFIRHPSYIEYAKPEQRPAGLIAKLVNSGAYTLHDDVRPEVLARICAGVSSSDFARPWMVKYFYKNAPQ